jgi:hypothetical protein
MPEEGWTTICRTNIKNNSKNKKISNTNLTKSVSNTKISYSKVLLRPNIVLTGVKHTDLNLKNRLDIAAK